MISVHKYLLTGQYTEIETHEGVEFLDVQTQRGDPVLWARVDTDKPKVKWRLATIGTGHPAPPRDVCSYVGTFQMSNGLVWHLFAAMGPMRPQTGLFKGLLQGGRG